MAERPSGSNRGPVERYQRAWADWMVGQPWCGAFLAWVYDRAGVDDAGLAHPSTAEMCRRARAAGAVGAPRPGAMIVWCGTHTELLVRDLGDGVWLCVGGNTGDAVRWTRRSVAGGTIVVPPAIARSATAPPRREYLLEDPRARPVLRGPWRRRAARDGALRALPTARRLRARPVRTRRGRFAFLEGPRRLYGPWGTAAARNAARRTLQRRLGRPLRPFSRVVASPAAAAGAGAPPLGKTT